MIIPEREKSKKIIWFIVFAVVVALLAFLYAFWLISQADPGVKFGYRCLGSVCSPNGDGDLCLSDKNCQPAISKKSPATAASEKEPCQGLNCQAALANDLKVSFAPYGDGLPGSGIAYFSWTYGSQEVLSADECGFKLQISESRNFDTLVVNRIIPESDLHCLDLPAGTKQTQAVRIELASKSAPSVAGSSVISTEGWINFKKTYYWRVQIIPEGENKNTTFSAVSTVQVPGHPAPSVSFLVSSDRIDPGTVVFFTDQSVCYTNTISYNCKESKDTTYFWEFGDAGSKKVDYISYYKGDVKHPYQESATAKLTVCDDLGCASASKMIRLIGSLPRWSEASPF